MSGNAHPDRGDTVYKLVAGPAGLQGVVITNLGKLNELNVVAERDRAGRWLPLYAVGLDHERRLPVVPALGRDAMMELEAMWRQEFAA